MYLCKSLIIRFAAVLIIGIVSLISAIPSEKRSSIDESPFDDEFDSFIFSRNTRANIDGGFLSRYNAARSFANMKAAERLARIYG